MIVTTPAEFLARIQAGSLSQGAPAVPRAVFLVEPAGFRISSETAQDNEYMEVDSKVDPGRALDQHRRLSERISACGIPALRFPGRPETPDDVFPNNVFATSAGRLIIGAMRYPNRRQEAERSDIRALFTDLMGYDSIELASPGVVAELTGVLVIDRGRRVGF